VFSLSEQRREERKRREQQNTRRDEVVKIIRQSKMASVSTSAEDPTSGKSRAPATRKFLNLFVNGNQYKSTGDFPLLHSYIIKRTHTLQ